MNKKDKWGSIQANSIYSAEIKSRIKDAPHGGFVFAFVVCPSIRLSVCPSEAGIVLKRLDESSWFWRGGFLPPVSHCFQEISVLPGNFLRNSRLPTRPPLPPLPPPPYYRSSPGQIGGRVGIVGTPSVGVVKAWRLVRARKR